MSPQLRILVGLASLLLLTITLELVRRGKLREEYSLLFLLWAIVSFLFAVFAGSLDRLALLLGIDYGPSLAFGVTIAMILFVLIAQGVTVSSLSRCNRDLAQKVAELEWQVRQLRQRIYEMEETPELVWPESIQKELNLIREQPTLRS